LTHFSLVERIYFQISPAIFDRIHAREGVPRAASISASAGMFLPESAYVLEQVLNTKPRNLSGSLSNTMNCKLTGPSRTKPAVAHFIGPTGNAHRSFCENLPTPDTDTLWLPNLKKLRDIVLCRKDEANTRKQLIFHTAQFEKHFANVARGADILDYFRGAT